MPDRNKQLKNNTIDLRVIKIKNRITFIISGNPAILIRSVAFRPYLSADLAFSKIILKSLLKLK